MITAPSARNEITKQILSSRWENTPPDSPRQLDLHTINPESDVYALPSQDGEKEIHIKLSNFH